MVDGVLPLQRKRIHRICHEDLLKRRAANITWLHISDRGRMTRSPWQKAGCRTAHFPSPSEVPREDYSVTTRVQHKASWTYPLIKEHAMGRLPRLTHTHTHTHTHI